MKKILILLILFTFYFGQSQSQVDGLEFQGKVTSTIRDTYDVPTGAARIIYNSTTGQFEYAKSSDVWKAILTEDASGGYDIVESIVNNIKIAPADLGNPIPTPYLQFSGGAQPNEVLLTLTDNIASLGFYSIADINAVGDASLITKEWADNYIDLKEDAIGNPSTNGYVLSSLTNGTRSWIAPPSGGSGDLWSDAVDASIVPDVTGAVNLGSASKRFISTYTDGLRVFDGTMSLDPAASPGGGQEGDFLANDSENRPQYHDGTSWKNFLLTGDDSDDQDASEVPSTAFGTIAATNVQDALEEIVAEATGGGLYLPSKIETGTTHTPTYATDNKDHIYYKNIAETTISEPTSFVAYGGFSAQNDTIGDVLFDWKDIKGKYWKMDSEGDVAIWTKDENNAWRIKCDACVEWTPVTYSSLYLDENAANGNPLYNSNNATIGLSTEGTSITYAVETSDTNTNDFALECTRYNAAGATRNGYIETDDLDASATVVVSFWAKVTVGTAGWSMQQQASEWSTFRAITSITATTWTQYTFTSNTTLRTDSELKLISASTADAGDQILITGLKIE